MCPTCGVGSAGMYVILVGAPGAGKGTQAVALASTFGLLHLASGDLFREQIAKGTRLGLLAKAYIERGALVPDDVTVRMVLQRLKRRDAAGGVILDGFPRTIEQATALAEALKRLGKKIDSVLYIKAPNDVLLTRLSGRLTCRTCGAVYHRVHSPPKKPGVCDKDGGELYQRPDDSEETARKRLEVYFAQTSPMIEHLARQGMLTEINGDGPIDQVEADLRAAVANGQA